MRIQIELDPSLFGRMALAGFSLPLAEPPGAIRTDLREAWLEAGVALKKMAAAGRPFDPALEEMRALRPGFDPRRPIYPHSERLLLEVLNDRASLPPLATEALAQLISLVTFCPAYFLDSAKLHPPLSLRPVAPGEGGRVEGGSQPIDDLAILADNWGALTSPTRQYDLALPDHASQELVFVCFAPQNGVRLQQAVRLAADLCGRHLEGRPMESFQVGM